MLNTQQVQFTFAADTDVGRLRQGKPNQDSFGTFEHFCSDEAVLAAKGKLFIVADGMGGAAGGKEASSIAVEVVFRSYYADPDPDLLASLQRAIEEANTRIHQHGREHPELRGLGTTIVLALLHGSTLIMGNVGDSRGYVLHQGQLQQLSLDHTSVQDQVRAGLLTPEEALTHPRRHVLSRNLGYRPKAEPEFESRTLAKGDTILLCSDGLSGSIEDGELAIMLRESRGEDAVEALINLANDRGGPDNITALVINIDDAGPATDPGTSEPLASRQTESGLADTPIGLAQSAATSGGGRRALLPIGQPLIWAGAALAALLLISTFVFRNTAILGGVTGNDTPASAQLLPAAQASPQAVQATVSSSPVADGVVGGAPEQVFSTTPALTATASLAAGPQSTAVTQFVTAQPRETAAVPTPPQQMVLGQFQVSSMALSRDGQLLASGSPDGMIRLWQLPAADLMSKFKADQTAIMSLAFSPDGTSLALASANGQVKLFSIDVIAGPAEQAIAMLNEERLLESPVYGLELTQNNTLRYVTQQGGLMIVSEQGGISALPLGQSSDGVQSVIFAADGAAVAILREDTTIQVVRIGDPTMTRDLPQRDNPVAGLAFSRDGHALLVLQTSGAVECWSVNGDGAGLTTDQPRTCKETNTLAIQATTEPASQATTQPVTGVTQPTPILPIDKIIRVAFSQDGQQLVSADQTGVIKRWSVASGGASEISEIPFDN